MLRIPKVALLLETSTEYGRGLMRGIVRYTRLYGPWSLYIAPGHFEQELPKAKLWGGTGIIARISSPELAKAIHATGLPAVALEACFEESATLNPRQGFGEILTNSPAIVRMAADHLLEHGLQSFAFCGFENCPWSLVREQTFCRYVTAKGFPCQSCRMEVRNWMDHADWIRAWGHEQPRVSAWLKSLPQPVGVVACNDICGRHVLQACAEAGVRVPRDVAVVGVDNDELLCELSDPPLSSVALDLDRAGYKAAHLLEGGLMSGRIKGRHVVPVNPLWVVTRRSSDVILQQDALVGDALRFIMDHARQAIGVPDVVTEVGISRRTLERRFLRAIRSSILSEITRCRLDRAKRLLRETGLPVYRVASESGFGSVKAFNRAFRLAESRSPAAFRLYSSHGVATDRFVKQTVEGSGGRGGVRTAVIPAADSWSDWPVKARMPTAQDSRTREQVARKQSPGSLISHSTWEASTGRGRGR